MSATFSLVSFTWSALPLLKHGPKLKEEQAVLHFWFPPMCANFLKDYQTLIYLHLCLLYLVCEMLFVCLQKLNYKVLLHTTMLNSWT